LSALPRTRKKKKNKKVRRLFKKNTHKHSPSRAWRLAITVASVELYRHEQKEGRQLNVNFTDPAEPGD
jgi:hypothetical protein